MIILNNNSKRLCNTPFHHPSYSIYLARMVAPEKCSVWLFDYTVFTFINSVHSSGIIIDILLK